MRLLEQYQSRLHGSHDGHEEELDYIKQILASPVFQQYLKGGVANLPQREKQEIVKASTDVLSGIDGSSLDDKPISPTEQRRRQIHRKQSLKALRNAVIPKSLQDAVGNGTYSNVESKKNDRLSLDGQTGQHQVITETSVRFLRSPGVEVNGGSDGGDLRQQQPEKRSMGYKSNSTSRIEHHAVPPPPSLHAHLGFPAIANGGLNHGKNSHQIDDGLGCLPQAQGNNNNIHEPWGRPMSLVDAKAKNLSNSSSMLIERPSPPKDYFGTPGPPVSTMAATFARPSVGGKKVSRESLLGGGPMRQQAALSGSQPNISRLRITQEGELEFDDLVRGDSEGVTNPIADETEGGTGDPGCTREWNNNHVQAMGGPGSVHLSAQSRGGGGGGASGAAKKLTLPPISPPISRPPPPPYQFNYQMQGSDHTSSNAMPPSYASAKQQSGGGMKNRRTKSYERLLDIDRESQVSYPNLAPLGGVMTNGKPTQDLPTAERRKSTMVVQLRKGKEGLGFMLNKGKHKDRMGDLFIQELQPGGVADRWV